MALLEAKKDFDSKQGTPDETAAERWYNSLYQSCDNHARSVRELWSLVQREGLRLTSPFVSMPGPWHTLSDFLWDAAENELATIEADARANIPTVSAVADNRDDSDLDRGFMEMAVEQARRSNPEDDRVHPRVGVVVVKDGRVLATAHRGELGKGDHAEYTALERKLEHETLAGATIYTTLEPCTTRNHPKLPCADRLTARKVGRVVIGMLDPDPRISGKGVHKLRDAGITVSLFPADLMSQVEELNREFIRYHKNAAEGGLLSNPPTD